MFWCPLLTTDPNPTPVEWSFTTLAVTMDWLLQHKLPPPNVIKIDIEGAELKALQGGLNMIKQYHPIIICEVNQNNSKPVTEIFQKLNYTLYNLDNRKIGAIKKAEHDTLALPPETSSPDF